MIRRFRLLACVVAALMLVATPGFAAPFTYPSPEFETFPDAGPPEVSAASWILYDDSSGTVLASHRPLEERAMASTTKIMTGLLALERADPNEIVTVSARAAGTGEKEIDLVAGERITMDALFKSLMIHSANDSATAIGEHIAGSLEAFVDLMNQRAEELGLTQTSFANPHGLDAPDHYTTAQDLLDLTIVAMETPGFLDVVRSKIVVIPPAPDGTPRRGTTTNLMLDWYEGTIGAKTGFTSRALLTYSGVAERDGRRLYVVVLGSDGERGHFVDATKLFDYGFGDLAYYGHATLGSPYVAAKPRVEPGPLLASGSMEAYVHLAAQGLMLPEPAPLVSLPEPEHPPVIETKRAPQTRPVSGWEALGYWFTEFLGS